MAAGGDARAGRRTVVCGAGTGVGKTHVACALAAEWRRREVPAVALKPIESGFDEMRKETSDAAYLALAAGSPFRRPCYALREPVSPHRAARAEGMAID